MEISRLKFSKEIDFDLIRSKFESEWVEILSKIISEYVNTSRGVNNWDFFSNPGEYAKRNEKKTPKEISDYFKRTLYSPNIYILDFICKNLDFFKDKIFLDNGAGMGLLSVYLKKLGITCFNYDNFSQISNIDFDLLVEKRMNLKIEKILNEIPENFDVLTSSGIGIINPKFLKSKVKLIMVDSNYDLDSDYTNKGIIKDLVNPNNNLKYGDLTIYTKK